MNQPFLPFGGNAEETVSQAKARAFEEAKRAAGTTCPCCERFMKINRVGMTRAMLKILLWMMKHHYREFVHIPSAAPPWILRSNCIGKMRHWRFVDRQANEDNPMVHKSGVYRITETGIQFAYNQLMVPSAVYIYDDEIWAWDDEHIDAAETMRRPFNFEDVRNGSFPDSIGDL